MSAPTNVSTTVPMAPTAEVAPAPRASGDWVAQTLRLVRWELFQLWRRVMAKVLLGVLLGLFAIEVAFYVLAFAVTNAQGSDSAAATKTITDQLTFPQSVGLGVEYSAFMGVVLLAIAAGVLVGGEYAHGTGRLALSRGVGRGQQLAAQVGALAVVAAMVVGGMLILGVLLGLTLGPALGDTPGALSAGAFPQLLAYWGATALRLFAYSLLGLLLATLGRSAAAGIGGALGFVAVELVALLILKAIVGAVSLSARFSQTPVPAYVGILDGIRYAFPQTNADALVGAARQGPLTLVPSIDPSRVQGLIISSPPALQAFVVLLAWCAALIGLSYLLVRTRDVTD